MRKEQNKKRLHPTKETGAPMKRRKVNDNEYASIKEIGGRPEINIQLKVKAKNLKRTKCHLIKKKR